jgi:hypothetical protein
MQSQQTLYARPIEGATGRQRAVRPPGLCLKSKRHLWRGIKP